MSKIEVSLVFFFLLLKLIILLMHFLIQALEPVVHGRGRKIDSLDETYLGVYDQVLYARKTNPIQGIILLFLHNLTVYYLNMEFELYVL